MKKIFTLAAVSILSAGALTAQAAKEATLETADPENGSVITSFNGFTVYFDGVKNITDLKQAGEITYQVINPADPDPSPAIGLPMTAYLNPDRRGIFIGFSEEEENEMRAAGLWPIKNPGNYTISFSKAALQMTTGDDTFENAATEVKYSLIPKVDYKFTPNPSDKLYSIEHFTLQFPNFGTVELAENFKATLKGGESDINLKPELEAGTGMLYLIPESNVGPGTYTLEIPAGCLLLQSTTQANQPNPEISVEYTILETPTFGYKSISPEPGSIVDFLGSVSCVYFSTPHINKACNETAKLYRDGVLLQELKNDSFRIQFAAENDDPNIIIFSFAGSMKDVYRESGVYKFVVPENFLVFDNDVYSPLQEFEYIIPYKPEYIYTPREGNVESLSEIVLTFPGATDIVQNELIPNEEGDGIVKLYVWAEEGEDLIPDVKINGDKITFSFPEQTYKCQYQLHIPTGAFSLKQNGHETVNSTISIQYFIPVIPRPSITPTEGEVTFEQLRDITLKLDEGYTYNMWFATTKAVLYTVNADGTLGNDKLAYFARSNTDTSYKGSDTIVLHEESPYPELADGDYAIQLTRSSFSVDGPYSGFNSCYYRWYYTVKNDSGVEEIFGEENGPVTVYGIDGVCVARNADKEVLSTLKKGLYIINGKKVLVK